MGNSITRFIYRLITGLDVYDTQSGLRVFNNLLVNYLIDIEGNRFEYEMNCLVLFNKNNVPFIEVPIETVYQDKTDDVEKRSHFRSIVDSFKVWRILFKHAKLKVFITLAVVLAIIIATIILF